MHVVLSGYYGFDNVGDEAILFSIIEALREVKPNITITVLSNNPQSTEQTYNVRAINRWKLTEVIGAIRESDGLISGGGSLLQDQTGIRSIPYYAGIMKIAQMLGKPVFMYAQGIGPVRQFIGKMVTKMVVNKVNHVTVRDTDSKQLLENIGIKRPISIVPDPVLGLDGQQFGNKWVKDVGVTGEFLSVSVRHWSTNTSFMEKIAKTLDMLVGQGYEIVFVPMHGTHDEEASMETKSFMKENSYVAPGDLSIQEKISIIGESKLLIGIRLHSLIFAAITYTPFVALSYDPKIDSFASIVDQPVAGHIAKDDWDEQSLYNKVEHSLKHYSVQQEILKNKVDVYKQHARETPNLAIKTFEGQ